jgi:hypothetical protein
VGRSRLPLLAGLSGALVGVLVASVLVASGRLDDRASAPPPKPATAAFLAAFHRSLTSTYHVDATFTRRLVASGHSFTSGATRVQQPPNHLQQEFGSVDGAINGFVVSCSTTSKSQLICGPSRQREDYATYVDTAMKAMRAYFDPKGPLYRVVDAGKGCFDLKQVGQEAIAPYGTFAHMCFDGATGAMSYLRENLDGPPESIDTFQAVHVTPQVSPSDFTLQPDKADTSTYHK